MVSQIPFVYWFNNFQNPYYIQTISHQSCSSRQLIDLRQTMTTPFRVTKQANGIKEVHLNHIYHLKQNDNHYETIELLVEMINQKNQYKVFQHPQITFFSSLEFELGKFDMKDEQCIVCMDGFQVKNFEIEVSEPNDMDIYQLSCSHKFHRSCLKEYIDGKKSFKCPICNKIYGKLEGDMPTGKITVTYDAKLKCQGYPVGTTVINYNIPSGTRNGKQYPGTSRTAYVPKTPQGDQIVQLLQQAWQQKLTFTIGTSVTTGLDNQVVWNGIHHKTSTSGGAAKFGYPDNTYFKRVKEELAAKGIVSKQGNGGKQTINH